MGKNNAPGIFDNEQLYYKNDVAAGWNNDTGGDDRGMNVDNGRNDLGMNDDEGEQQVKEEMGEAWERVTKKRKSQMSDDELRTYFDSQLRGEGECLAVRARRERGHATCGENSFSQKRQHNDGRAARSRLVAIKQFSKQAPHPPHH